MRFRLIRLLLRLLGHHEPVMPDMVFYAVVEPGNRIADVTTNLNRARAIGREARAKGTPVKVLRCIPVANVEISYEGKRS